MKRKQVLMTLFICVLNVYAARVQGDAPSSLTQKVALLAENGNADTLEVRKRKYHPGGELPFPKAPVRVPRITLSGHTLEFVTPCQGLTLQLVKSEEEVCYETVITGDTLEIPSGYEGVFELRILQGDFIFYAEIEL